MLWLHNLNCGINKKNPHRPSKHLSSKIFSTHSCISLHHCIGWDLKSKGNVLPPSILGFQSYKKTLCSKSAVSVPWHRHTYVNQHINNQGQNCHHTSTDTQLKQYGHGQQTATTNKKQQSWLECIRESRGHGSSEKHFISQTQLSKSVNCSSC